MSREPRDGAVAVPALAGHSLEEARGRLERAGLFLGRVYEMDRRRVERTWGARVALGRVFSQRPAPGLYFTRGGLVDVLVAAERDGPLPASLPAAPGPRAAGPPPVPVGPGAAAGVPPPPPPPGPPAAGAGPPPPPAAPDPGPVADAPPSPPAPAPSGALPGTAPEGLALQPPGVAPPAPPAPAGLDAEVTGHPDAPRVVRELDPSRVPDLRGLALNDAEQWIRDLGLQLYVERVGGHPIGRVLRQTPDPGTPRPAGDVVKVLVTAGGDYEEHAPGPPAAVLEHVEVPEVLDRTAAQARRILTDLGLKVLERVAPRGLAGRVVDQLPSLGDRLLKGEYVLIWIGPPDPKAPAPAPPAPDPAPDPAPGPRVRSNPGGVAAAGGAPVPIAPSEGTVLPREASLPLGFSWRAAPGAEAYLLEIEEETAPGAWLGLVRKPVRTTAAVVEVERLGGEAGRRLRWRVRAVRAGREGPASDWVVLR